MTDIRSRAVRSAMVFVFATACASPSPGSAEASPSTSRIPAASPSSIPTAPPTWLVVLRSAADPAGVRDDAAALASVLGDAIQVAPGSCFAGLPARFGGDRYILGAVGESKAEVDELATDSQIAPLFEGEVQVACVD